MIKNKGGLCELALFSGAGGGILGAVLCGHTIVGAIEIEEYPREVLKQRQRDEILDKFPIWDDVCTFRTDNQECREYTEMLKGIRENLVISGGFPCQDISSAGKGAGIAEGTRSGLWFEFSRIIGEIRPAKVFVENSPLLVSRGLDIVLSDLAEMGYDAKWGIIGGSCVGNVAEGERLWLVANSSDIKPVERLDIQEFIEPCTEKSCRRQLDGTVSACLLKDDYRRSKRNSNEVASQMDRLKAIGNGQVPAVVRLAWKLLE